MPTIDLGYVVGPQGPQGATGATGATGSQGNPGPNQVTGSTSTTLSGVLQGNGSKVSALASDSTPTEDSTNLVRSGTVYNSLNRKTNPNLLRNAYFVGGGTGWGVFPVNQRGASSYSGAVFGIDSWKNDNSDCLTTLFSGYVRLKNSSTSGASPSMINQYGISDAVSLADKTITMSALYKGNFRFNFTIGSTVHRSNYYDSEGDWALAILTYTFAESPTRPTMIFFVSNAQDSPGLTTDFKALKVEIGSQQTLAHKENGVWVLNEIPDYETELLRCQTAQQSNYADDLANMMVAMGGMIARVEYGLKPSGSSIASGKLFCWRGQLYKATATISTSTNINPGTNCTQTTLAAELNM